MSFSSTDSPLADAPLEREGGYIHLIIGPMFSGKSTELLRVLRMYELGRRRVVRIKFGADQRYGEEHELCTHDSVKTSAFPVSKLSDVPKASLRGVDVVGVDEGQMFPDLVEFCEAAANDGKVVVVSALDGDFLRRPFGQVHVLLPMAERVVKLFSVCQGCGSNASFSRRLTADTAVQVVGGAEMYRPVCRKCFFMPASEFRQVLREQEADRATPPPKSSSPTGETAGASSAPSDVSFQSSDSDDLMASASPTLRLPARVLQFSAGASASSSSGRSSGSSSLASSVVESKADGDDDEEENLWAGGEDSDDDDDDEDTENSPPGPVDVDALSRSFSLLSQPSPLQVNPAVPSFVIPAV